MKFILDTRLSNDHFVMCTEAIRLGIIEPEDLNEGRRTMAEQQHFFDNQPPLAAKPRPDAPHIWEGRQNHALDVNSFNGAAKRLANFYESRGVDVVFNVPGEDWHFQPTSEEQLARAADKIRKERDAAVLKPGEREKRVKFLKHQLHWTKGKDGKVYYRAGKPRPKEGYDELYNKDLVTSVKRFQKEHNLTPDGVIGPKTDKKIDLVYATQKRKRRSAKERAEERKRKAVGITEVSPKFIDFLASWEGERLEAYQVQGEDFWTIGVGHARTIDGKPIRKGQKITKEKSRQLLAQDLNRFEQAVVRLVPKEWRNTQQRFETCVSLAFNMGEEILTAKPPLTSFAEVLKLKVTKANIQAGAMAIQLYNKGGTPLRVMPGLVRRRRAEAQLWLNGKYIHN